MTSRTLHQGVYLYNNFKHNFETMRVMLIFILVLMITINLWYSSVTYALDNRDVKAEQLMYSRNWDQGVVIIVYKWIQYGTGWWVYIDNEHGYGYIATAAHVIAYDKNADEDDITIIKGSYIGQGKVVYCNRYSDVCIIRVHPIPKQYYIFPISVNITKGMKIITIGYPYELLSIYSNDLQRMSLNPRATFGEITWYEPSYRLTEIGCYTDAGNSGGPVLNEKGSVIGIVTFALTGKAATLYFCTTSQEIIEALERAHVPYKLESNDIGLITENIINPWNWNNWNIIPTRIPLLALLLFAFILGMIIAIMLMRMKVR